MADFLGISDLGWLSIGRGVGGMAEAFGTIESGRLARIAGEREKAQAQFLAWQAEREASIALAIGQLRMLEERRMGDVAASRALAVAAASGGDASDPTVLNIMANIQSEAYYRASVALWEGEEEDRKLRLGAAAARVTGSARMVEGLRAETAANIKATGGLLRTGATLYARYAKGGPDAMGEQSGDEALLD